MLGETDPEIAAAVEGAARLLAGLGHHVEEVALPEGSLEEFLPLWQHLVSDIPFVRWSRAQPITRWLGEPGRFLRADDMTALRRELEARLLRELGDADIWLTPTVATPAPRVGAFANRPPGEAFADAARLGAFTAPFNISGQPADREAHRVASLLVDPRRLADGPRDAADVEHELDRAAGGYEGADGHVA